MITAKYSHTNLIARDWRALAKFYQDVFSCVLVPPERDFRGEKLDAGTGIPNAHLQGAHLRLPGYGDGGPTLELFQYDPMEESITASVNRPGYGHIAFSVDDVGAARSLVLEQGGSILGEVVTLQTADGRLVTWCYVRDPEGNILELQSWRPG